MTVGQDAVGSQIRQLQNMLLKQLTGRAQRPEQKTEQESLDELVEAMTMRRALVVLDDPWLPEQVRFLNPVDRSGRTEHRLLVTTRIRDLVPKAPCLELSGILNRVSDFQEIFTFLQKKHTFLLDASASHPERSAQCFSVSFRNLLGFKF